MLVIYQLILVIVNYCFSLPDKPVLWDYDEFYHGDWVPPGGFCWDLGAQGPTQCAVPAGVPGQPVRESYHHHCYYSWPDPEHTHVLLPQESVYFRHGVCICYCAQCLYQLSHWPQKYFCGWVCSTNLFGLLLFMCRDSIPYHDGPRPLCGHL